MNEQLEESEIYEIDPNDINPVHAFISWKIQQILFKKIEENNELKELVSNVNLNTIKEAINIVADFFLEKGDKEVALSDYSEEEQQNLAKQFAQERGKTENNEINFSTTENFIAYLLLYFGIGGENIDKSWNFAINISDREVSKVEYETFLKEYKSQINNTYTKILKILDDPSILNYEEENKIQAERIKKYITTLTDRDDLTVLRPSGIAEKVEYFFERYPIKTLILADPNFRNTAELNQVRKNIKSLDASFQEIIENDNSTFTFKYNNKPVSVVIVAKEVNKETLQDFPMIDIYEEGGVIEGTDLDFLYSLKNRFLGKPAIIVDLHNHASEEKYPQFAKEMNFKMKAITHIIRTGNSISSGYNSLLDPGYSLIMHS